jgi:oxygen-independent coproporphyrinogen III oxidase
MSQRTLLLAETIRKGYSEGRIGHFTCTYPPHKVYSQVDPDFDVFQAWSGAGGKDGGVSLYVHVPFCKQRCSFCNLFMVKETSGAELIDKYVDCLIREIDMYGEVLTPHIGENTTLYFGGGTPSMLNAEQLGRVIAALGSLTSCSQVDEFTLEVAPETADAEYLSSLRELGVTRVSLGVQSIEKEEVRRFARKHTRDHVMDLIDASVKIGFPTVNVDLIYGHAAQTVERWQRTLLEVLEHSPQCLTIYPLNVKPQTGLAKFGGMHASTEVDRQIFYAMYDAAVETLELAGYEQQTRTLFLRGSGRYIDKLNEAVGRPVKGFGAGAQTYTPNWHYRTGNSYKDSMSDLQTYISNIEAFQFPARYAYKLSTEELQRRQVALSIRYKHFPLKPFKERFGVSPVELFPEEFEALTLEGLVNIEGSEISLTEKGLRYDNLVSTLFFSDRVREQLNQKHPARWSVAKTHPTDP